MTDQELIELLQQKPPGEYTPEEFAELRARWTQSPELRQALIDQLHLESQLSGALGQVDLDIDKILERAADHRRRARSEQPSYWRWTIGLSLLLVCSVASLFWFSRKPHQMELADSKPPTEAVSPDTNSTSTPEAGADAPADALVAIAQAHGGTPDDVAAGPVVNPAVAAIEPPPIVDKEPWSKTLSREVAPWPAGSPKLTRDFKTAGHDELPESEARRWFSQVDGHPFNWSQDVYQQPPQRRVSRFNGLGRLRAPWPDDALLRLTPYEVTDLTIYLWRGPSGVALRLYTRRDPHTWAAYQIVRENSSPKPLRWGLLTTDSGSYVRAGLGTIDLRYQDGGITLARGGVPLLTAPLSARPDEVFIEGQFRLRGISIHRSAPLISIPENPHPIIVGGPPAQLDWTASAETPAEMVAGPDGLMQFKSDSRDKLGAVVMPLKSRGLYEVIARVDSADPGTGLFLGDLDGRPVHRIGFFKDSVTGRTTVGILRPGELRDQVNVDFNAFPAPYHTSAQWVKIVAGLGTMQIQVSGDGRHWGHLTDNPARDLPGAVGSVGVFGLPGPAPRTLKLASLEVRDLAGLTSLAQPGLVAQAPRFTTEEWADSIRWTHRAIDAMPAGVQLRPWMNACTVAALSQGPPREAGVAALKGLLAASVATDIPAAQKIQMLEDASILCDLWEEAAAQSIAVHFDAISQQLAASGDPHPLATVRPAIIRSPMWTVSKLRFSWEKAASRELLTTAYRGDWSDAWQTAQSMLFWNSPPAPDAALVDPLYRQSLWVRAVAVENVPQLDDGQTLILSAWRHPLAMQWNKEAYNVRSELQSALAGQTYEDACRIVMSINASDGPGLLPDMEDRQLFVSLPTSVASAMQVHPEFARLMVEKFGPLGVIRVRQAIQSGNQRGVQAATLQFFGTEAAAEAHQWLGDLDMSAGRFPSAEEHFLLGLAHCLPRQKDGLQSRLQLALALNGKPLPESPASYSAIDFSGSTIPAGELESLVKSLLSRPSPARRFQRPAPLTATMPPRAYRAQTKAGFDGQPGLNPGRYEYRFGDPFGKQLAVAHDDRRIYVSNRLQVNAYALPNGEQQWAQGLGSEQGEAHAMAFTPMPPLVAGDRLFVRRLGKAGAELACLNADNGQVVWTQRPNLQVLSDPVFWNGSLFALTLSRVDDDVVQVEGTRFDFETGIPTSSQSLFRLRDSHDRSNAAQLTIAGRLAVCTLNGLSACFDGSGEIHWLRRHLWLPKVADELFEDFRVCPPLVHENRVIVSVPGVRTVACMDLETGRQIWSRVQSDLRGIITAKGSRVLLDTVGGVVALSAADGTPAWSRPLDSRLEAFQVDDEFFVTAQRMTLAPNKSRPYLKWIDLDSGREVAQSQVEGIERAECQMGPLVFAAGKWWSLAGQGWKEAKRDLVELASTSDLVPGSLGTDGKTGVPETATDALLDLALVMPAWHPEASYGPRFQLSATDVRGETFVVKAKIDLAHQVRLLQFVDVPAGRKTTLKMRFGNVAERRWQLTVRAGDQNLLEQMVEDAGSSNGWRDAAIDLTPFAGKRIPVQLIQSIPPQQQPSEALWKRAVVVVE